MAEAITPDSRGSRWQRCPWPTTASPPGPRSRTAVRPGPHPSRAISHSTVAARMALRNALGVADICASSHKHFGVHGRAGEHAVNEAHGVMVWRFERGTGPSVPTSSTEYGSFSRSSCSPALSQLRASSSISALRMSGGRDGRPTATPASMSTFTRNAPTVSIGRMKRARLGVASTLAAWGTASGRRYQLARERWRCRV